MSNVLVGRDNESGVLEALIASARGGEGGALVVHGEPGVGKTALIEYVVARANEFNVLRVVGFESEMELAYASLQELLRPHIHELGQLEHPQRHAVEIALGRAEGDAPDRLLVGLGVLNLLSLLSSTSPILCVVDDAQWLDTPSAQAITFAARHVSKEAVAFLFGARSLTSRVRDIPQLRVTDLGDQDARVLLESVVPVRLDAGVLDRLVAETHGNPLAILELPRGLSPAQLAGGFGLPASVTVAGQIEENYRRRLRNFSADSRRLLLIIAADSTGDPRIIWKAADWLGITGAAEEAIEDDGLVQFGERVIFRHPLVRSAVYSTASPKDRRDVHRALAEATDIISDPDRRAWHRAQAAVRPDETVATELEASADRAQARAGFAAAGALLERAVALSVDPGRRAARALRAAQTMRLAGALDAASGLAAVAERGPLEDLQRAQLDVLLGQMASRNRWTEVSPLMLKAASRLEHVDEHLARDAYLEALIAALFSGHLAGPCSVEVVARAARPVARSGRKQRPADLLLAGLVVLVTDGQEAGTGVLKRALSEFRGDDMSIAERLRWSWVAGGTAGFIWDYDTWDLLTARHERLARDLGALSDLPITLSRRVSVSLFAGDVQAARSLLDQVQIVTETSERRAFPNAALFLAAVCGDVKETHRLIDVVAQGSEARRAGMSLMWARALLYNNTGRYEEAFLAATAVVSEPHDLWFRGWATVELIEAASRTDRIDQAQSAMQWLAQSTNASGSEWALGVQARCQALLSEGADAERLYREAIERLEPTRLQLDLARGRLVYGEWLRRQHRPREARDHLRRAYEMFVDREMSGFANRAAGELRATGEKVRKRTVATLLDLTAQERRISELAATGTSNPAIAEQLFISPATVEYHLSKVYRKLGIRSRNQLAAALNPTDSRSGRNT